MSLAEPSRFCPIIKPTKLIGDVWTLLIIKSLLNGSLRFNQIRSEIPEVTSRTLTQRLKSMCAEGLITRTQFQEIPPRVEYQLTEMGLGLKSIIEEIEAFGNKWMCD